MRAVAGGRRRQCEVQGRCTAARAGSTLGRVGRGAARVDRKVVGEVVGKDGKVDRKVVGDGAITVVAKGPSGLVGKSRAQCQPKKNCVPNSATHRRRVDRSRTGGARWEGGRWPSNGFGDARAPPSSAPNAHPDPFPDQDAASPCATHRRRVNRSRTRGARWEGGQGRAIASAPRRVGFLRPKTPSPTPSHDSSSNISMPDGKVTPRVP